jgi:hypothetical protein
MPPAPFAKEVIRSSVFVAGYYLFVVVSIVNDAPAWLLLCLLCILLLAVSTTYISRHGRHSRWHRGKIALIWLGAVFPYVVLRTLINAALTAILVLPVVVVCAILTWTWLSRRDR